MGTTYYWRVNASNSIGTSGWSSAAAFTTLPAAPAAPVLSQPTDNATEIGLAPVLSWAASAGAAAYNLQLAADPAFNSLVTNASNINATNYNQTGLSGSTIYYWRVNAQNAGGTSAWSNVYHFTTLNPVPSAPVLLVPSNESVRLASSLNLSWNAENGASAYDAQVSVSNDFSSFVVNQSSISTNSLAVSALEKGQTYYWRVRAVNTAGSSAWSAVWSFSTDAIPVLFVNNPADNILVKESNLPVDGTVNDISTTVKVNGSTVNIGQNKAFTGTVVLAEGSNTVRIAAYNSVGDSTIVTRIVRLDTQLPVITLSSPSDNLLTNQTSVTVAGTVTDANTVTVKVNGNTVAVSNGSFSTSVSVTEGSNTITVTAQDEAGNQSSATRTVRNDVTAPVITLNAPADNLLTNQTSVTVAGTVADANTVTVKVNGSTVAVENGSFSTSVSLTEGSNTITVTAQDEAGNQSSVTRTVRNDITAPVITLSAPTDNLLTNQSSVTVTGTVADANTVTVKVNGNTVAVENGNFTTSVSVTEGSNTITVTAQDEAGNQSSATRNIRNDVTAPVITLNAPSDNLLTNQTSITVTGTVTDANSVTVKVNGSTVAVENGSFSTSVSLTEGSNTITVTAQDEAGNQSSVTRTVRNDITAPVITLSAPTDNLLTNQSSVTVAGTVADANTVTVKVNGSTVAVENGNFTTSVSVTEGSNTITVTAQDEAGNQSSVTRTVRNDITAPVITLNAPSDNLLTNQTSVTVAGIVADANAVTVKVNGSTVAVENGSFSTSVSVTEGSNTITVTAQDETGNQSSEIRTVKSDITSPDLSVFAPDDGMITNSSSIQVQGYVIDANPVTVTVNDIQTDINNRSFNSYAILNEGSNTVSVVATDAAGNKTTVTRQVKLDRTAPEITVTSPEDGAITNNGTITITGTVNDSNSVNLIINGRPVVLNNGSFSASVDVYEGMNSVTMTAIDAAGNVKRISRTILCDLTAPQITISSPAQNYKTNASQVVVNGLVTDATSLTVTVNGVEVSLIGYRFTKSVDLVEGTNTITINATDAAGNTAEQVITVIKDTQPPVISLSAPVNNAYTNNAQLQVIGVVSEAQSTVSINGAQTVVNPDGSFSAATALTEGLNSITVRAADEVGNADSVVIHVNLDTIQPQITIETPAENLHTSNNSVVVSGAYTDASPVTIMVNGAAAVLNSGSYTAQAALLEGSNQITVTARDEAGNSTVLTRNVFLDSNAPVITILYPAANSITDSSTITIFGTAAGTGLITLTINSIPVPVDANGHFSSVVNLVHGLNNFVITASDSNGHSSAAALTVRSRQIIIPPDPATIAPPLTGSYGTSFYDANSFLFTSTTPVQYEVTPGAIEPYRMGVVRGTVVNTAGAALTGVKVYSPNHPEWGYTYTRPDGKYDFGLNAGGYLVVNFEHNQYRPATRVISSQWNQFIVLDTVALVQLDTLATVVNFRDTFTVAQASVTNDSKGTRRSTVFFEQGTVTRFTLPDNSILMPDSITVRVTEYTRGDNPANAKPADLPAKVSFTYCTELTADEALARNAKEICFSLPARLYSENFIGFPVGTAIPTGMWNKESMTWQPLENGIVLKYLGIDNGKAIITLSPTEEPATDSTLAMIGLTPAERKYIVSTFTVGQTLWRTKLLEFGIIDQGFASIQPDDAKTPKVQTPETYTDEPKYGGAAPVSAVDVLNQTIHTAVTVPGTGLALTYSSDRVDGRKSQLVIPLTEAEIHAGLRKVKLFVTVLGVKTIEEFSAAPNLSYIYIWDGKDSYGRTAPGRYKADILIGYEYACNYQEPVSGSASFGSTSGYSIPNIYNNDVVTLWKCAQAPVGEVDNRAAALGGWNLDIHHGYDPVSNTVYMGSGQTQISEKIGYILETVAGNGNETHQQPREGLPAVNTEINAPSALRVAPDGSVFFVQNYNGASWIRKITPDGIVRTVAGSGVCSTFSDSIPALQAPLCNIADIAIDRNGNIYALQPDYLSKIVKIDTSGLLTIFAGKNGYGCSGDDGPAIDARLFKPLALEFDKDGNLYVSDQNVNTWSIPEYPRLSHTRIRKIAPDGIITTVAGGTSTIVGQPEGRPATTVRLDMTNDLKIGPEGDLYMAVAQNEMYDNPLRHSILRLDKDGRIHRVTKGGFMVNFQPGTPADRTVIMFPQGLLFNSDCSICYSIIDGLSNRGQGHRIGIITSDFINNYLTGRDASKEAIDMGETSGHFFSSKDGTPAKVADVNTPTKLALGPDGSIYFSETGANKIRRLKYIRPGRQDNGYSTVSNSGREIFYFDSLGRHIRTEEALTGVRLYNFIYDAKGRLIRIADPDSLITSIERDTAGVPKAIVAATGERTVLGVNPEGYLNQVTKPGNESIGLNYISGGLLHTYTDPRGNSALYDYDSEGRLIAKQLPETDQVTYQKQKTADGYTVTQTLPLGEQRIYRIYQHLNKDVTREITSSTGIKIDVNDMQTFADSVQNPDGTKIISETGFDPRFGAEVPLNSLTRTVTPSGLTAIETMKREITAMNGPEITAMRTESVTNNKTTRIDFRNKVDGVNSYEKVTSPLGRIAEKYYDAKGRVIKEFLPGAGETEYIYNIQDELSQKVRYSENDTLPERREYYFYDSRRHLISSTDAMWRADSMRYDSTGRMSEYIFKDGRKALFSYDANGNVTSIIPPGKTAHIYEYDAANRKAGYAPPVIDGDTLNAVRYRYNRRGSLTETIFPDSSRITLSYDTDQYGRQTARVKSVGYSNGSVTYNYDSLSEQITSVIKSSGDTLSYTYDGSLPTSETWKGFINGKLGLAYNNDFQVTSQSINDSNGVSYLYDDDGMPLSIGELKLQYDSVSAQLKNDTLRGIVGSYAYNGFGEPSGYTVKNGDTVLFKTEYWRDALGRITSLKETIGGVTNSTSYIYDTTGRLTQVYKQDTLVSVYSYDNNGNRIAAVVNGIADSAAYNAQDGMLAYGSTRYRYDKNGCLLYKAEGADTTRYTYDNLGNLLKVVLPNATIIEYIIDAQNRRIGRKVNGIVTNRWLYSGELTPIAELDSAGNVITRYVYGTKSNIPDYYIKNDTVYRIISDHLGSLRMVVNTATGEVVTRVDYDEYGRIIKNNGTAELPFGFAGGMYDSLTGLVRFGARDYSAREGRWTAKDPIQFNGGDYNLYGYCLHDPVNEVDYNGKSISGFVQLTLISVAINISQNFIEGKTSWTDIGKSAVSGFVEGTLSAVLPIPGGSKLIKVLTPAIKGAIASASANLASQLMDKQMDISRLQWGKVFVSAANGALWNHLGEASKAVEGIKLGEEIFIDTFAAANAALYNWTVTNQITGYLLYGEPIK